MSARQGYLLIATGPAHYLALATACAASLHHWDGTRPVHLATDAPLDGRVDPADRWLFDGVTVAAHDPDLGGPLVKLRAAEFSPFEETMFIDSDCLLLKPDIGGYWDRLAADTEFAMPGEWRTTGEWYGMAIAEMRALVGIDRLAQMTSGVIYFKRAMGETVFALARELLARLGNFTDHLHHGAAPPDEPYLALAASLLGLQPHPLRDADNNSWHTATFNSRDLRLDAFSGTTAIVKPHRTVSPSVVHFANLYPPPLYAAITGDLLAWARSHVAIREHVSRALRSGNEHSTTSLGAVSATNAARVREQTGVDIRGYERVLQSSEIRHVFNSHRAVRREEARAQIVIRKRDFRAITAIVERAHAITRIGEAGARKPMRLEYIARLDGNEFRYVEELHANRIVAVKAMRKKPV